jgi:hypothetical protein
MVSLVLPGSDKEITGVTRYSSLDEQFHDE